MNNRQVAISQQQKQKAIDKVVATLQAKHGQGVIQLLKDVPDIIRLPTGLDELDNILHGGLPRGRLIEVFGLRQSGKTAVACQLASQASSVMFIDAEHKMTPDMAAINHLPDATIITHPPDLETALEMCRDFFEAGMDCIVLDSLPALPCIKDAEQKDYSKNNGFSPTAGLLSRKLPIILNILYERDALFIIVNQYRSTVNAMAFGEKYHTFGGLALANYASTRLTTARTEWLKNDTLGVFGMTVAILVDKSNTTTPRAGTSLPLVYDAGLLQNDMLPMVKKQLIDDAKASRKKPRPQPEDVQEEIPDSKETIITELDEAINDFDT